MKTYIHLIGMFGIRVKIMVKHTVALVLDRQIMVDVCVGIDTHTCQSVAVFCKFRIEETDIFFKSFLYLIQPDGFAE